LQRIAAFVQRIKFRVREAFVFGLKDSFLCSRWFSAADLWLLYEIYWSGLLAGLFYEVIEWGRSQTKAGGS